MDHIPYIFHSVCNRVLYFIYNKDCSIIHTGPEGNIFAVGMVARLGEPFKFLTFAVTNKGAVAREQPLFCKNEPLSQADSSPGGRESQTGAITGSHEVSQ